MKAFPGFSTQIIVEHPSGKEIETKKFNEGMELRDYFAAKAMQAILTKTPLLSETGEHGKKASHKDISDLHRNICFTAYSIADAMMEARK